MTRLCLANIDYPMHITSEGNELQLGLQHAGWLLAGAGFGDGCRDVPALLGRHRPEAVFVQDKRDWDPSNAGAFRKDIGFNGLSELAKHPEIFKIAVVKDAGSMIEYHRAFCEEIAADAVLIYYHDLSVLKCSPWLARYPLVRTYHSVDADLISGMNLSGPRRRAVVSGAMNREVYPLRDMVAKKATTIDCDVLRHPGYSNHGCQTPNYLRAISGHRVSIATASFYGFALRKIIEAVAVAATPVTNLPEYDCLPEIDSAIIRVSPMASTEEVRDAVDHAERTWNLEERLGFSRKALAFYDYRAIGARLSANIEALAAVRV